MENKKRAHLIVSGDVQGVNYRYFAKDIAKKMNLTGWTENNPNGSLEIVVEGDEELVNEFVRWCHQGSPMSTIEKVEEKKDKYTGEFREFEVR